MTTHTQLHPCAKVNLGLNIVGQRPDGYHDIETVFYPIPLCDELTVDVCPSSDGKAPDCRLTLEGRPLEGDMADNLVVRAYRILANDIPLPPVSVTLRKVIPSQAGLGGGSSDAAAMLKALNSLCNLRLSNDTLRRYAARLGADCAFFIDSLPALATGIGDILHPIELDLKGWHMLLVKPDDAVNTAQAYAGITVQRPTLSCADIVSNPVSTWQGKLCNDFEASVLPKHPLIDDVRRRMEHLNADYIQMSGSGSTMFALSREPLNITEDTFPQCWIAKLKL